MFILFSKRDPADGIRLRNWRDYSGICGLAQYNHMKSLKPENLSFQGVGLDYPLDLK